MSQRPAPDLLDAVRRYWRSVLLVTAGCALASAAVGTLLAGPPAYATATVALTAPSGLNVVAPGVQGDASLARYASQRALFMRSDEVLGAAVGRLPGTTVAELRAALTAQPSNTSTSVVVTVSTSTPQRAVSTVDAVVSAYGEQTARQVGERTAAALDSLEDNASALRSALAAGPTPAAAQAAATTLSELTRQAGALQADSAVFDDGIDFVQAPSLASAGTSGPPVREGALGLLLGLGLGATVAWLRADRDRLVRDPQQLAHVLGSPLLAIVPAGRSASASPFDTELTRHCRDVVVPLLARGTPLVLVVTEAVQAEAPLGARRTGSSQIALALTDAAAGEGLRAAVVDADPGSGAVSRALGLDPGVPGLVEAASGSTSDPDDLLQDVEISQGVKASALPVGNWQPSTVLTVAGVRAVVDRLRAAFDVVVLDAPLLGDAAVSPAVATLADGVLVVVGLPTPEAALERLSQSLALHRADLLGYVATTGTGPARGRKA